jgi:hypothetical protein
MIKWDINRWKFLPNKRTSDPCISISDRAKEHKGTKNYMKQKGLHPCIHDLKHLQKGMQVMIEGSIYYCTTSGTYYKKIFTF